jgi:hypothetical protein
LKGVALLFPTPLGGHQRGLEDVLRKKPCCSQPPPWEPNPPLGSPPNDPPQPLGRAPKGLKGVALLFPTPLGGHQRRWKDVLRKKHPLGRAPKAFGRCATKKALMLPTPPLVSGVGRSVTTRALLLPTPLGGLQGGGGGGGGGGGQETNRRGFCLPTGQFFTRLWRKPH